MSIFTPGRYEQRTQSGDPSSADIATRLAAIKLILGQLGRGNQSFGDYLKHGPQRINQGGLNSLGNDLLSKASAPGAFTRGPTVQTGRPASPSMFQDLSGGLVTLALLRNLLGGGGGLGSGAGTAAPATSTGNVPMSSGNSALDALITSNYGSGGGGNGYSPMVPGGDASQVPADYPGLMDDSSSWLSSLMSYV